EDADWRQRLQAEHPNVKIIVMSAVSPAQGDFPAHAYLPKPFTPATLCEVVERARRRGMSAGSA
ncbi:MAG: hypothetical protein RMI94_09380, partial [Bryobacterales bacterium]|nr:hypothetical protein [Bryobacteraceae bacterium]MDW8130745.1 hypothetical protein [Bryobacterales bacterium]